MSISIIVPIYNVDKYLCQCLDSIVKQSYRDLEILLIDDGSKDKSGDICDEYAALDNRIQVIHKINGGYGSAVNVGLEKATGEYIAIVEPDDWLELDAFEIMMRKAMETDADIVKAQYRAVYPDGIRECPVRKIDGQCLPGNQCGELLEAHPSIWTCLYKASLINEAGKKIRMLEVPGAGWTDNLWQVQTILYAHKIYSFSTIVYNYRIMNRNSVELLKDWHIPCDRSDEIHEWLKIQPNVTLVFLRSLYLRERNYIYFVICKMNRNNWLEIRKRICNLVADWDVRVFDLYEWANDRVCFRNYKYFPFLRSLAFKSRCLAAIWRFIERWELRIGRKINFFKHRLKS